MKKAISILLAVLIVSALIPGALATEETLKFFKDKTPFCL